ncbi:MAG TPA: glycosyltransferase family 4 protein [Candidatus Omnitrophota bacterium]|nr:glycosyltransferase family 4 protein [Candidatus Omnitrophota bacterium]
MNILIVAKVSDYKIMTTLEPLIQSERIEKIYLVRRFPISLPKVVCYSPPLFLRWNVILSEIWRIVAIFFLCFLKEVRYLIGIHYYYHCIYVGFFAQLFSKPYIFSLIENPQLYRKSKIFSYFVRRADAVMVRGNISREFLMRDIKVSSEKIHILLDILENDIAEKLKENQKKYDFVFLGYFRPEKRIDVLIRSFYRVVEEFPRATLLLIGEGPLKKAMLNLIKYYDLEKNVSCFDRFISQEEVYSYLWQSKTMIMTSETEGLPTVLLEAMLCEIPFIVPDVGDITDLAKDNENALVVTPLNEDEFKHACLRILKDEAVYQKLKKGIIEEKQRRLIEHDVSRITALWEEVLK